MPVDLAKVMDTATAYTTNEIAELLDIKPNSARQRLQKAYDKDDLLKMTREGKTYWARKV